MIVEVGRAAGGGRGRPAGGAHLRQPRHPFRRPRSARPADPGLRDGTDLDYEMADGRHERRHRPDLLTVFLPASPEDRHVTATLVRQIAQMGGAVAPFVPPAVAARLAARFRPAPFLTGDIMTAAASFCPPQRSRPPPPPPRPASAGLDPQNTLIIRVTASGQEGD